MLAIRKEPYSQASSQASSIKISSVNEDGVYHIMQQQQCIICNCKTRSYNVFECIHRPTIKKRREYGYIGKTYYIKIFSCDEHYVTVKNKMKDRVLVCSDVSDFHNECFRIFV